MSERHYCRGCGLLDELPVNPRADGVDVDFQYNFCEKGLTVYVSAPRARFAESYSLGVNLNMEELELVTGHRRFPAWAESEKLLPFLSSIIERMAKAVLKRDGQTLVRSGEKPRMVSLFEFNTLRVFAAVE